MTRVCKKSPRFKNSSIHVGGSRDFFFIILRALLLHVMFAYKPPFLQRDVHQPYNFDWRYPKNSRYGPYSYIMTTPQKTKHPPRLNRPYMDPVWDGNQQRPSQELFDAVLEGASTPTLTRYDWKTIFRKYFGSIPHPGCHSPPGWPYIFRAGNPYRSYRLIGPSFVTVTDWVWGRSKLNLTKWFEQNF